MALALRTGGGEWAARFSPSHALVPGDELIVVTPHETWLQLHRAAAA
jgi:hypothetical protein